MASRSELILSFQGLYRGAFGEVPLAGASEYEKGQELKLWHEFAAGLKPEEIRPLMEKVAEHWGRRGRPRLAAFWVVHKEMRGEGLPEYKREEDPNAITFEQYLREYADENHPTGGARELIDFYRSRRRPRPRRDCGFWPLSELIGPGTGTHTKDVSSREEVEIIAATSEGAEPDEDDVDF